jgi:hypothetical protein
MAETSATERRPPQPAAEKLDAALCQSGAVNCLLRPLPPSSQAVLLQLPPEWLSDVPPTATTLGEAAGKLAAAAPEHAWLY